MTHWGRQGQHAMHSAKGRERRGPTRPPYKRAIHHHVSISASRLNESVPCVWSMCASRRRQRLHRDAGRHDPDRRRHRRDGHLHARNGYGSTSGGVAFLVCPAALSHEAPTQTIRTFSQCISTASEHHAMKSSQTHRMHTAMEKTRYSFLPVMS